MRRYWWFIIVFFVIQCNDDDQFRPCRLTMYKDPNSLRQWQMEYNYKELPFVVSEVDSEGSKLENGFRRELIYDNSNRIVTMKEFFNYPSLDNLHEFEYSESQIVQKVRWTPGSDVVNWMITYTLGSDGRVTRVDEVGTSMAPRSQVYRYVDGNIASVKYIAGNVSYIDEYEYDQHKNPFKGFGSMLVNQKIFSFMSQNENNYVKVTTRWDENSPINNWDEYQYTYNSAGYPVKMSEGLTAPYFVTSVYEYSCDGKQ